MDADANANAGPPVVPMMEVPSPHEAERAVREARAVFGATLSRWASDLLALRQASLDRPTWTAADDESGFLKAA